MRLRRLILVLMVASSLLACQRELRPFEPGKAVDPPQGCKDLRERGGEC